MRKIIIIYLLCIIGLFFLPMIMVKEKANQTDELAESEKDRKIRLLISEKNEVVQLTLDEYIMGVLVGEMPVSYELEALKAQAVVTRTYTLNKLINSPDSHEIADMCDDINHCQAYKTKEYALSCWDDNEENEKWNKIKLAVLETKNEVITYNGELINAFFHADSGGKTEDISNIWGRENIPYLKSVVSVEEPLVDSLTLSYIEIDKRMKEKYKDYEDITSNKIIDWSNVEKQSGDNMNKIEILEVNSSGRVEKFKVSNIILSGTDARAIFELRSTQFNVCEKENSVIFETRGYGHGIGMSQNGANAMAIKGHMYKEIIKHYYSGVEITTV